MKTYIVKRAATINGTPYREGDLISGDELRPGVLRSCLRTKMIKEAPAEAEAFSDVGDVPAGETIDETPQPEDPHDGGGDAADGNDDTQLEGFADERLDASIDTLEGVEPAALEILKAAELLCIGDLVEHLKEHGSLVGVAKGIGQGRADQLAKALAPYMPAQA